MSEIINNMGKGNSFFESILMAAGLIGGAWITSEIIKNSSKKKIMYKCPICSGLINLSENPCSHCGSQLVWQLDK